jgi:release factor glutamine methyltransferase
MTAATLLGAASERLAAAGVATARLDAEVLLAHALGLGRAALYARLREAVEPDAAARFEALVARRRRREPVAYLTGEQEFWSLPFAVTPDVLIPRPETELIVSAALEGAAPSARRPPAILDLGTGSGCLAVALARELPAACVTAVDVSPAALAVARRNAERHGVAERIAFLAGDLYAPLPAGAAFDLVVSNPPYLAPGDAASPEVAFEPRAALFAGADGLDLVRRLVAGASAHLRPGARLLVEIGCGQAGAVLALAAAAGLAAARVEADLAGIPRLLVAQRPGSARGG